MLSKCVIDHYLIVNFMAISLELNRLRTETTLNVSSLAKRSDESVGVACSNRESSIDERSRRQTSSESRIVILIVTFQDGANNFGFELLTIIDVIPGRANAMSPDMCTHQTQGTALFRAVLAKIQDLLQVNPSRMINRSSAVYCSLARHGHILRTQAA